MRGASRKEIMEKYVLEATKREIIGKKVKALRREGLLPAVIIMFRWRRYQTYVMPSSSPKIRDFGLWVRLLVMVNL